MPEGYDGERTEPATPRKRHEARQRGQVARSTELTTALVLLLGLLALAVCGPRIYAGFTQLIAESLQRAGQTPLTAETAQRLCIRSGLIALREIGPFLFALLLVGVLASYGQVGFLASGDPITPKFERIDPLKGFKRLFSARSMVHLGVSIAKMATIGGIAYAFIAWQFDRFSVLIDQSVGEILVGLCKAMFQLMLVVAIALLALALLDYGYQWWQHEKDLRMSRRELLDELKHTEGDPQIKARIRQIQRETARRRMLHRIPKADVVVTNPTHYAVALQYEAQKMSAPVVVAKGKNLLAKRIIQIARSNHVPVVENPPLAQALYKSVEVGEPVPPALYRAVAQVLANIYRLRQAARARVVA